MKQVNVFLYCENELNPQIVLYLVMVGKSEREQKAHAWLVRHCAGDNRFFYHRNSAKIAEFLSKVRQSWTDAQTLHLHGVIAWRSRRISPCDLKSRIIHYPLEFLNSEKAIDNPKIIQCA